MTLTDIMNIDRAAQQLQIDGWLGLAGDVRRLKSYYDALESSVELENGRVERLQTELAKAYYDAERYRAALEKLSASLGLDPWWYQQVIEEAFNPNGAQ